MVKLGEYLKQKRLEQNLSLREAAKLSNVSHVHIRAIENDEIVNPSFFTILALLNAYKIDTKTFIDNLRGK